MTTVFVQRLVACKGNVTFLLCNFLIFGKNSDCVLCRKNILLIQIGVKIVWNNK